MGLFSLEEEEEEEEEGTRVRWDEAAAGGRRFGRLFFAAKSGLRRHRGRPEYGIVFVGGYVFVTIYTIRTYYLITF